MKFRGAWPCKVKKVRQQFIETVRFFLDDFKAVFDVRLRGMAAFQDSGCTRDACERIAYFMGQSGRKLSRRIEPFRPTQTVYVSLQFLIDLFEFACSLLEPGALLSFAIGEKAGNQTRRAKYRYLN